MLERDRHSGIGGERYGTGQHFVKRNADRIQVALFGRNRVLCLLGRNVVHGAEHFLSVERGRGGFCFARNAEVGEFCFSAVGND